MVKKLFSVYDKVAETLIGGIVQESTEAPAIRAFYDALAAPSSGLGAHPDDYVLYELGELNVNTGLILPVLGDSPVVVATGTQWKLTIKEQEA